jgi:hypothetical protein
MTEVDEAYNETQSLNCEVYTRMLENCVIKLFHSQHNLQGT